MSQTPQAEMSPILAVGAVVVHPDGRVLLVRRGRPPAAGTWTLPGGRVQAPESPRAAIVREVREETALSTRVVCALGVVPLSVEGVTYAIHEHLLVPVSVDDLEPVAGDDAAEARWVARAELDGLGVSPEVTGLIERAGEELVSRHLVR